MNTLRLAVVTETYVPDVNGVANSLRQLLKSLSADIRIQIIRTRPDQDWCPEHEEVWTPGVRIPMYPDLQLGLPVRRRITRVWDSYQPDVVYIATEGPLGWAAFNEARLRGIPVVSAFHTNFHRYSGYYGIGWLKTLALAWLRRFHNRTARTIVPSADVAGDLRDSGFQRVEVLPHGVDCQLFHPQARSSHLREQWGADRETPVLLYVGRIAAEKNIPLAIKAWQRACLSRPDTRLVMVGDGPLRAELQQQYPQIVFAGVQTGEALARYFASADAFIFPSLTETFGLVVLEAMASGLPVVAFDMAAAALHVCSGVNGELAKCTNDEEFIQATLALLASDVKKQGLEARKEAEKASWQSVAGRFERILHEVIREAEGKAQSTVETLV